MAKQGFARRLGGSVSFYPLATAAVAATGILVAGLIVYINVISGTNLAVTSLFQRTLESASTGAAMGVVSAHLADTRAIAASTDVVAALQQPDPAVRRALATRIASTHADIEALWLMPSNTIESTPVNGIPLSFAARDMIRRAINGQPNPPEYYLNLESRSGYIQVVAPASDASGIVVAYFSPHRLQTELARTVGERGRVRLSQEIGGNALDIAVIEPPTGQPDLHDIGRMNPMWTLDFDTETADLPTPAAADQLYLPFAIALLALLVGTGLAHYRLMQMLRLDVRSLGEELTGRRAGSYRLAMFERLAALLRERGMPADRGPAAPAGTDTHETTDGVDLNATAPPPLSSALPEVSENETLPGNLNVSDLDEIEIVEESDDSLGLEKESLLADQSDDNASASRGHAPAIATEIFRAYDIRGVVGSTLTTEAATEIARALGSEALDRGQTTMIVGADGRLSSPELRTLMIAGIRSTGCNVIDIGEVPTPLLYYATCTLDSQSGVMITGSHNPPDYNGFKMVMDGDTLAGDDIQGLLERIHERRYHHGEGEVRQVEIIEDYINRIAGDIVIAQTLQVVVDCGNGVAGAVAPALLRALGCEVTTMYCDVDGTFPNHHPDPAEPENLQELIAEVKRTGADIGLAFDGDGDRVGVVTNEGDIIWPDRLLMLFCRDIVGRNPGSDVIFDVKCSRHLNSIISDYGGRPIMWMTGHSNIKRKIKETGALIGGEFSGHICFLERWYGFDDGLYSAARLLEIVGSETQTVGDLFRAFPDPVSTPEIKVRSTEDAKFGIMDRLAGMEFGDASLTTIDGIRADFADGWGLVRASNTSPMLTLRFEADEAAALVRIQQVFRDALTTIDPSLAFEIVEPAAE